MDRSTFESQKAFAGGRKPSMLRRCIDHDYRGRRMYLITLATEGRRPLLGQVRGKSTAKPGSVDAPTVELTALGAAVAERWMATEAVYPEIKVVALQMMPDHLHGILFVKEQMGQHLGMVIRGFKAGCNKAYRRLVLGQEVSSVSYVSYVATRSQHTLQAAGTSRPKDDRRHGLLFARGYNDRLLLRAGQLDRWLAYLADNPRRLLAKREHPDLFRVRFGLRLAGQAYAAIGNRFLLSWPMKRQVKCSRSLSEADIAATVASFLDEARQGAVLVSPSLSPGERAVMRAALDAGLPLIFLSPNSFTPYTKPGGEYIEACGQGRLLILAPWEHRSPTQHLTRAECLTLNTMALAICDTEKKSN